MTGRAPSWARWSEASCPRHGFTLIEIAIVLAVLAVITCVALSSYRAAANRTRRSEGKILLQSVLAAEERYYLNAHRYTGDAGVDGLGVATESQPGAFYALARLDVGNDGQSVVARVDPRHAQDGDACGSLTLDSNGRRGASGAPAADCW